VQHTTGAIEAEGSELLLPGAPGAEPVSKHNNQKNSGKNKKKGE
jgi:hypothetical protein